LNSRIQFAVSKTTAATLALAKAGIAFTLFPYDYDPDAPKVGLQAAEALSKSPDQVFKTLMAEVDGKPVCVVVPSDCEVSMKKLAATFGGKSAQMMKPADAERLTGFKVGGISPSASARKSPPPSTRPPNSSTKSSSTAASAACSWGCDQPMRRERRRPSSAT
jgi:Cys-tRNA(Pro)/Cys-tRNA(Cys) deacylase